MISDEWGSLGKSFLIWCVQITKQIQFNKGCNTDEEKSSIYSVECGKCHQSYYGQTRRSIVTRYKEHTGHIRNIRPEKSSKAEHVLMDINHFIERNSLKLLKSGNEQQQLDAWESLLIHKNKQFLMSAMAPVKSNLFDINIEWPLDLFSNYLMVICQNNVNSNLVSFVIIFDWYFSFYCSCLENGRFVTEKHWR